MLKVFLSSTYRDLAEHREVLRLALETSGYDFRGMEHFPPQDNPPLDVCLEALESCDVYVGILGALYGSCPPGRVRSYTELEYLRACTQEMYRVFLVLAPDARVRPEHVEQNPDALRRLQRFRDTVCRRHTVQTFHDAHEAAWRILAALRNYEIRYTEEGG